VNRNVAIRSIGISVDPNIIRHQVMVMMNKREMTCSSATTTARWYTNTHTQTHTHIHTPSLTDTDLRTTPEINLYFISPPSSSFPSLSSFFFSFTQKLWIHNLSRQVTYISSKHQDTHTHEQRRLERPNLSPSFWNACNWPFPPPLFHSEQTARCLCYSGRAQPSRFAPNCSDWFSKQW